MSTHVVLRAHDHSLVLDLEGPRTPRVLHWGSDLGELDDAALQALRIASQLGQGHSAFDEPLTPSITYNVGEGYYGMPTVSGHRAGTAFSPLFLLEEASSTEHSCVVRSLDREAQLRLVTTFTMSPQGTLHVRHELTNLGAEVYTVDDVNMALPLPAHAREVMDFTGNWSREFHPQVHAIQSGLYAREIREGRTGHDSTMVLMARTEGTGFNYGEVWGVSLAWSGNSRYYVERIYDGSTKIGTGELLLPGEVILAPGETYAAPEMVAVHSSAGLDGVAASYHEFLRARPNHPRRSRPLTINVWEAVYMDHRIEKLRALADVCAEIGIERYVLDDGWFGARRDDHAGLGDWVVAAEVWPQGLATLADYLEERNIEFGLWFEPEMVNPDSDLYRAHPEWILHVDGRTPPEWRYQQVLDLTHEGAYAHVLEQMDAVLTATPGIRFIKWDHNRPLTDPGHLGHPAVRAQTLAVYRLMDELKRRHPGLEIESCASGGGRIDLGIMEHCDRVHASDNNEALDRQRIQRWTSQLLPLELMDAHACPSPGHTAGRSAELSFRLITALFGHAGLEWDVTQTTPTEREQLHSWADYYKANRELLHSGRMVRLDHPCRASSAHGVVAKDRSRAIFAYVQESVTTASRPIPLRFAELDPDALYDVREVRPAGRPRYWQIRLPKWIEAGVTMSGKLLMEVGIQPPILCAEQATLIELTRI